MCYKRNRKRSIGAAGRRFKLVVVKDRVIMVLVYYYRLYITYTLMEYLFNLDQSNVYRDIEKIEGLIRECLPIPEKLYNVTKRLKSIQEVEEYFPGFMAFTDCTEQQILPRPTKRTSQEVDTLYYSKKRKKHTQSRICILLYKPEWSDNLYKTRQNKTRQDIIKWVRDMTTESTRRTILLYPRM